MNTQKEILSLIDFTQIDNTLQRLTGDAAFSFQKLFEQLLKNGEIFNLDYILKTIFSAFSMEFQENKTFLLAVCMVGIFSAVLRTICGAFENHQIADTGFYSIYLVLFVLLMKSFLVTEEVANQTIGNLVEFTRTLLPAFCLSVGLSTGQSAATAFYGAALFVIALIIRVILQFILPLIKIYVILCVVDHISNEQYLKKLTELLQKIICFLMKSMMGAAVGINLVQGMIAPVIDTVRKGVLTKAVSAIPGMGGITNSVLEAVVGSAILVKNSIGIAGFLALLLICLKPVVKLLIFYLMYQLTAAFLGPVAQREITDSISDVGEGVQMLLRAVWTSLMLFFITIAIIIISTSQV